MATENVLMAAVKAGGDRQDLHERIRRHSLAARARVVEQGGGNDLVDRMKADPAFSAIDLDAVLDPSRFTGRSAEQVEAFLEREVEPIRRRYPGLRARRREIGI